MAVLTRSQRLFGSELARLTGLERPLVGAWLLNEMNGSAAAQRESNRDYNWLNIGWTDSGQRGTGAGFWRDPVTAARTSARWLRGEFEVPGFGRAAPGIVAFSKTAGKGVDAQVAALQRSGWASSGYPDLPGLVDQYSGKFGLRGGQAPAMGGGQSNGGARGPAQIAMGASSAGEGLAALLAGMSQQQDRPVIQSAGVQAPSFAAAPTLPQGYSAPTSSGGPVARSSSGLAEQLAAVAQLQGPRATVVSGAPGGGRARRGGQSVPTDVAGPVETALRFADNRLGTTEVAGSNTGGRIDDWQRSIIGSTGNAWCGVFVGVALRRAGVKGIDSRVASTAAIVDMARNGEGGFERLVGAKDVQPGDVWVTTPGPSGHTGIVEKVLRGGRIVVLEGNSSDAVRRVTRTRDGYFARPAYRSAA